MENMSDCSKRLEELRCQAMAQVDAAKVLQESLAEEADYLQRRDQAQCLDDLRTRVERDIADLRWMEDIASSASTKATLFTGLAGLAFGTILGAALHTEEHPLLVGARLANNEFKRTEPFGTIAVAVGDAGVPDDVQVVSLSKYARKQRLSEWDIRAEYEAQGYRLLTPDSFFKLLDQVKDNVLKGVSIIRTVKPRLILKPADPTASPPQKPSPKRENQG